MSLDPTSEIAKTRLRRLHRLAYIITNNGSQLDTQGKLQHPLPKPWIFGDSLYFSDAQLGSLETNIEYQSKFASLFLEELRDYATFKLQSDGQNQNIFNLGVNLEQWWQAFQKNEIQRLRSLITHIKLHEKLSSAEQREWDNLRAILENYKDYFFPSTQYAAELLKDDSVTAGSQLTKHIFGYPMQFIVKEISILPKNRARVALLERSNPSILDEISFIQLLEGFMAELRSIFATITTGYYPKKANRELYGRIPALLMSYPGLAELYLKNLLAQFEPIDKLIKDRARSINRSFIIDLNSETTPNDMHLASHSVLAEAHTHILLPQSPSFFSNKNALPSSNTNQASLMLLIVPGALLLGSISLILLAYKYFSNPKEPKTTPSRKR